MPACYAVERHNWQEAAALQPRTSHDLAWDDYWWPESLSWFARGLGAVHRGDLATARRAERRMTELRDRARAADEEAFATYIEIDRLILSGWVAQAEGDAQTAVARMQEAAELERTVEKHVVTPGALLPAYEALGDLLMEQQRPREALQAYETSLEIWPNRYNSQLGAARAARAANEMDKAREHYGRLLEITKGAATDRPGVREAREFAGVARSVPRVPR
jgi:tetratricopeptide (TPR) repeat protein